MPQIRTCFNIGLLVVLIGAPVYTAGETASAPRACKSLVALTCNKARKPSTLARQGYASLEERIQATMQEIKPLLEEQIRRYLPDTEVRTQIINRMKAISFEKKNCSAIPEDDRDPEYDPGHNSLSFCGPYDVNSSEFPIVQIAAHEMSHSFSPCAFDSGALQQKEASSMAPRRIDQHPFAQVLHCLRGHGSMAARLKSSFKRKIDPTQYYICPPDDDENEVDQLDEAFADWMAAEVLPLYMAKHSEELTANHDILTPEQLQNGYAEINKDTCGVSEDDHPPVDRRNDFGLLVQPEIRHQMDCPPDLEKNKTYCGPPDFSQTARLLPPAGAAK